MRKLILKFFYCLICFFISIEVFAQLQSVPIIPRFKTLNVEEGLSQSSVYSIYQDSYGFMWFGTADGINRYDGKYIKVFRAPVSENTPANSNFARGKIVEDKNGNIWYSTETGLFVIDRLTKTVTKKWTFNKTHGYSAEYHLQFCLSDTIWFLHKKKGVGCYSILNATIKMYQFPELPNVNTVQRTVITSSSPKIWYNIVGKKGANEFNCITKKFSVTRTDLGEIGYYKQNSSSDAFFFNGFSVFKTSAKNIKGQELIKNSSAKRQIIFRDFIEDEYNRVWMASMDKGLYMYDLNAKYLHHFEHKTSLQNSLSINFVNCLFIDRSKNLWVGTDGGGVCKLDLKPSNFNLFPLNEGDFPELKDYFTKCFYEDEKSRIWYGTHNNGLCIYNPFNHQLKNIKTFNGKPLLAVGDIFKDAEHNIWIGHSKGISLYNEAKNYFKEVPITLWWPLVGSNIFVYRFIQRKNGDILAATSQQLALIKKNAANTYAATVKLLGKDTLPSLITDLKELPNGDILFCSPSYGVILLDSNLNNVLFKKRFLKGIDLRCIYLNKTKPNHAWIGTGTGLVDLNIIDGTYTFYNQHNGLANDYIYGIVPDENDNLWLSTNGGICYFNTKNYTAKNFTAQDGLQSNEFNTGAYYKGASGNIYFGGIKGFNWFNTAQLNTAIIKPQVSISEIKINDINYTKDSDWLNKKSITLPYYSNDIDFVFAALDFTKPEANKIRYQLIGWDPKYIISNNREAKYNNLPPGKYTLQVSCSNSSGAWSDAETISIIIEPPFWKTWWFYILCTIAILSTIVLLTKFYTQQKFKLKIAELERQRELDMERQRISREMHDDIGAGLTQITLMSESAKRKSVLGNELDNIALTSRQLVSNMSEIVWSLNPDNKTLEQLLSYLREQLNKLLEHSNIHYSISFPENGSNVFLQNNQSRNILLITKEITHNAIKYSCAKHIQLSCKLQNNCLLFIITDDGVGFNTAMNFTGNGLKNIKARIESLKGELTIQSEEQMGCTFTYKIPL